MICCRICGEEKPDTDFSKKDRDRRFCWCKVCAAMYQEMKMERREAEWKEAQRKALEKLKLNTVGSFLVTFK
jgi:hypothetical protein